MSKVEAMLGFAAKAGQIVTGSAAVAAAIKKRHVYLVICTRDLSTRTIKNFSSLCSLYKIDFVNFSTRIEVGKWVGRPDRGVIGVVSKQFAAAIRLLLKEN
jgi:ribosomal protein L7Ae-like RNA K-turn-binding protein